MQDDPIDKSAKTNPEQDPGSPRPSDRYIGLVGTGRNSRREARVLSIRLLLFLKPSPLTARDGLGYLSGYGSSMLSPPLRGCQA